MKKALICIICLLLAACSDNSSPETEQVPIRTPPAEVRSLAAEEAFALLEKRRDLIVLDIRPPQELNEGVIERSMIAPYDSLVQGTMDLPGGRPILLVCGMGGQSLAAARILVRNGYSEVFHLKGGIIAWQAAGLPLKHKKS